MKIRLLLALGFIFHAQHSHAACSGDGDEITMRTIHIEKSPYSVNHIKINGGTLIMNSVNGDMDNSFTCTKEGWDRDGVLSDGDLSDDAEVPLKTAIILRQGDVPSILVQGRKAPFAPRVMFECDKATGAIITSAILKNKNTVKAGTTRPKLHRCITLGNVGKEVQKIDFTTDNASFVVISPEASKSLVKEAAK